MSSKLVSTQCLVINLMAFFMLITQVYLTIDSAFSSEIRAHWLIYVGGISYCFNALLIIWIFNRQSEDIKLSVAELRDDITKLEVRVELLSEMQLLVNCKIDE